MARPGNHEILDHYLDQGGEVSATDFPELMQGHVIAREEFVISSSDDEWIADKIQPGHDAEYESESDC